jgi:hypothetical protein
MVGRLCPAASDISQASSLMRKVKKLKRVEIAELAAFHRLTSNGLLRLKNSVYNFAFTAL